MAKFNLYGRGGMLWVGGTAENDKNICAVSQIPGCLWKVVQGVWAVLMLERHLLGVFQASVLPTELVALFIECD